jgi:Zinc carboxypeptidase
LIRRIGAGLVATAVLTTLVALSLAGPTPEANATPYSNSEETYLVNGRVWPDPHGCRPDGTPGTSPYAKGTTCAADFIQYEEMTRGSKFLEATFPKFTEYYTLAKDFNCKGKQVVNPEDGCKKFRSAGLPVTFDDNADSFVRERRDLHFLRITDERVPNKDKKWFVFPLSLHGIERAGVEGGLRAAEDLATWGACEAGLAPEEYVDCESEDNAAPHPLMEATPEDSISAGEALKKSVVVFMMPNADGWLRGDRFRDLVPGAHFYQRYNGNGVDINRDWPTSGFTFRPYTPSSEPEVKAFSKVLPQFGPEDARGNAKWHGGIDLHGQLIDRAFSFTLLGAGEHDYAKNQRILQLVKGAWKDAEKRLEYSPLIKPNDAPEDEPGIYGVQWGTVWDTIDYTITGGIGDWINNPIGLNADGIDNEMSMSHLSTCGVGTCYIPEAEQLHVDGNKSLVYSMINYTLKKENTRFETQGRIGYIKNPEVVSGKADPLKAPPKYTKLPHQEAIMDQMLNPDNDFIYEFEVLGPKSDPKVYNGGIEVKLTCLISPVNPNCELTEALLERLVPEGDERPPDCPIDESEPCWEVMNSYWLQGTGYVNAGKALHANFPEPGQWRIRLDEGGGSPSAEPMSADIFFTGEKSWPDPGQLAYKATNMEFWSDLAKFAEPGVEPVTPGEVKNENAWMTRYDTIVVTDKVYDDLATKLKNWVASKDGNLVLFDKALGMLPKMGLIANDGVSSGIAYAGYINFETEEAEDESGSYDDPSGLAQGIDQPGAAEGGQGGPGTNPTDDEENHRHQTYEPVPIGYSIQDAAGEDQGHSPVWWVTKAALDEAGGNAVGTTLNMNNVSLGEIEYQGGKIRFAGAVLPQPTDEYDNPFGLASHALTYSGYQVVKNLVTYERP